MTEIVPMFRRLGARWFRQHSASTGTDAISYQQLRTMSPDQLQLCLSGAPCAVASLITAAARYGFVDAQVALGQILLDGNGMECDRDAAFRWFRAAAGAGHVAAKNMTGRCYEKGWGVAPQPMEAANWYRQAAEAGHDWGQYNLASLLLHGSGISCDRRQALHWYSQAAGQGHAKSMNMIGRFFEEGWEVPRDPRVALAWYVRSAHAGDYRGQYNLATVLLGEGRTADACLWLRRAVASGSSEFLAAISHRLSGAHEPDLREVARIATARCRELSGAHSDRITTTA